jgi:cytochrome P450
LLRGQDIYQSDGFVKTDGYTAVRATRHTFNLFNVVDKIQHRFRRRAINPGLSDRALRESEPNLLQHIDLFVQKLIDSSRSSIGEPVNLTERCKRLGFDIVGQFGFGQSFEMQSKPHNRFLLKAIQRFNVRWSTYLQFPLLRKAGSDVFLYPLLRTVMTQYRGLVREMVDVRMNVGQNAKKDLFSYVVGAKDPETQQELRLDDLWSEASALLIAGM